MFRKGCLAVCFLLWRLFDCSSTTAAPQQQQQPPAAAPAAGSSYVLGTKLGCVLLFRMCFEKGVWLFVSCFGGCLIAAAPQQHHSSSSSHQQQHQQQAAAGSSRQAAAGSRRQQQAAAGSRQQQTPAAGSSRQRQAAAKFQFYSMVSEVTLGPFLGFLCYVLDTKLGGGLLFRMCFEKGVWLFVSCFGGCLIAAAATSSCTSSSMVSEVTLGPFLGFLCYVLDTKLGGGLLFRMCFEKGVWLFVSCFGGCLIAAAPQQQQPPAAAPAAGSSREQQAAAGSRQLQAAGSSRQQQAAACSSRHQQRRFGHEIRWCFAVSDVFRKGCLAVSFLLWRLFDSSSTTAAAAAAPAAGSSREQQAGSSRQQRQQQPAAGSGRQRQSCYKIVGFQK